MNTEDILKQIADDLREIKTLLVEKNKPVIINAVGHPGYITIRPHICENNLTTEYRCAICFKQFEPTYNRDTTECG